jgi:hypothetical protein
VEHDVQHGLRHHFAPAAPAQADRQAYR